MNSSPISSGLMFVSMLILTGVVFGTGMSIYNGVSGAMQERDSRESHLREASIEVYNVSWNDGALRFEIDITNTGSIKMGTLHRIDVYIEGPLPDRTNMIGTWVPHESMDGIDMNGTFWNATFTSNNDKNPAHLDPGESIQVRVHVASNITTGAFHVLISMPDGASHASMLEL